MRKINASINDNDRIVCTSYPEKQKHTFYYQPAGTREKIWLFDTKNYSKAIFTYFRSYGTKSNDKEFSLTVRQLYTFNKYCDRDLAALIKRIPGQLEYLIREYAA